MFREHIPQNSDQAVQQRTLQAPQVSGELTYSPLESIYKKLPPPKKAMSGDVVELAALPRELSEILRKYDYDGDGHLNQEELHHAQDHIKILEDLVRNGRIPFWAFPERKQKMLRQFDTDQNEELDAAEILNGLQAAAREKRRAKVLWWFTFALMIFSILLIVGICGLLAYIRHRERDADFTAGGKMLVRGSKTEVVQTASTLFEVKDGVLVDREASNRDCLAGQQCTRPLAASAVMYANGTHHTLALNLSRLSY